jgi:hypothetical protein
MDDMGRGAGGCGDRCAVRRGGFHGRSGPPSTGYGRLILQALFDAPEVADVELIGGGVEPENVASIACLRSAGFSHENKEPDFEGMVYFVRRR